ncbi:hypothetical protein RM530_03850 [Algiphilus sp. W345]|uniref:Uncharacterized protein n=1 Tax=Banduia mediterranea TaxID=3075609 RepID=A0ABU2WFV4_9GAMM|nr:hypothetical protein [Algiphilus sp. W345]MDT0496499.1 hypothetical protein [Algiphilus sp. W345]
MTPADWTQFEAQLAHAYGSARLRVDGYDLSLQVQRIKGLRYEITVYVNGWMKGEWLTQDCEERRRFLRPVTTYLHTPKERARMKQTKAQERLVRSIGIDPDKKGTYYVPWWTSAKALRRHLIAHNESIEWIKEDATP